MIPKVNIISRKTRVASVKGAGGHSEPLSEGFRGQCPLTKLLGSKLLGSK